MKTKKIKAVMLEEAAISDNGDISLDGISSLCDFTSYKLTDNSEVAARIGDADAVFCNKCSISRGVIESCPNLKYIGECATGYNNIDIAAAKERGIVVTNAGQYSTMAVAQHVFGLILSFYSRISEYSASVRDGGWIKSPCFIYYLSPTYELNGKTLGIIGFGAIGKAVAKIAEDFGMNVIINTRTPKQAEYPQYKFVSKREIFEKSDVVTLHCPLTPDTTGIVNEENLSLMKKSALLINTSRGGAVDENALCKALNEHRIMGAGLDVISSEPMAAGSPFVGADNYIITPHIAWAPHETQLRLIKIVADNFKAWLNDKPTNIVS